MKKLIGFLVLTVLLTTPSIAGNPYDSLRIKTRPAYEEKKITQNGRDLDVNLFMDLYYKERCRDFCKFKPYIFNSGRIRYYGLDNGLRFSYELKRIKPTKILFAGNYFRLEGYADIIVKFEESKGRFIYENVPVSVWLDKEDNFMELSFLGNRVFIEDINWR